MAGWKKLEQMKHLSKPYTRVDGPEKVTGSARYTYDVKLPGMLHASVLRSPHAHARVKKVEAGAVESSPGVKAVLAPIKDEVLFFGDDVAAVAAVSELAAQDALSRFAVDYEILPFTVDETEAREEGAPRVFSERDNNLGRSWDNSEGDVDAAFAEADVVLERTYHLRVQLHTPLETHGCVAKWEGDELYIWDTTQTVHGIRSTLARHFEIPESRVHVYCDHMGGGFGSKLGVKSYHIICARLARLADRPVKLMLDRESEMLAVGNRPSSIQKIKIGAKKDGTLTAFEMESYGTGGIGGGAGVPQPYIYRFPNVRVKHTDVHINAGPAAPMRAPGHPQANFAMESIMDELAEELGIDPLELRLKNDPNETRQKEYRIAAEKFGWNRRVKPGSQSGTVKRGMGLGSGRWGGSGHRSTQALVSIFPDGSVDVKIGTQDIGTGTRTIAAGVVAEQLGLDVEEITPNIGSSDYPWAPASGGSRTAPSISPAIKRATEKVREKLRARVAEHFEVPPGRVQLADKAFSVTDDPDKTLSWREGCKLLGGQPIAALDSWGEGLSDSGVAGCQFAEVEVDTETGAVKVLRVVAVQDCGLVVNRLTATSQVQGAIVGEIGYVLLEDRLLDGPTGIMVNANLENYKLPGAHEMPEFDVSFVDQPERGVIGLGEPPAIPGVGAIANAIANAIGVRVRETPITPDRILTALANAKEGEV